MRLPLSYCWNLKFTQNRVSAVFVNTAVVAVVYSTVRCIIQPALMDSAVFSSASVDCNLTAEPIPEALQPSCRLLIAGPIYCISMCIHRLASSQTGLSAITGNPRHTRSEILPAAPQTSRMLPLPPCQQRV